MPSSRCRFKLWSTASQKQKHFGSGSGLSDVFHITHRFTRNVMKSWKQAKASTPPKCATACGPQKQRVIAKSVIARHCIVHQGTMSMPHWQCMNSLILGHSFLQLDLPRLATSYIQIPGRLPWNSTTMAKQYQHGKKQVGFQVSFNKSLSLLISSPRTSLTMATWSYTLTQNRVSRQNQTTNKHEHDTSLIQWYNSYHPSMLSRVKQVQSCAYSDIESSSPCVHTFKDIVMFINEYGHIKRSCYLAKTHQYRKRQDVRIIIYNIK